MEISNFVNGLIFQCKFEGANSARLIDVFAAVERAIDRYRSRCKSRGRNCEIDRLNATGARSPRYVTVALLYLVSRRAHVSSFRNTQTCSRLINRERQREREKEK